MTKSKQQEILEDYYRNSTAKKAYLSTLKNLKAKTAMNEQTNTENRNRYFACKPPNCSHNQLLTITAVEAERIKTDPEYHDAKDPVKTYASDYLFKQFQIGGYSLYSFYELPQEEGDRMQTMFDVLNGCVTVEELEGLDL